MINRLFQIALTITILTSCTSEKQKPARNQFIREAIRLDNKTLDVRFRLYLNKKLEDKNFWKIKPAIDIVSIKNILRVGKRTGIYIVKTKQAFKKGIKYTLSVKTLTPATILPKQKTRLPYNNYVKSILARYKTSKPQGKTIFIGSSSFTKWHQLERDLQQFQPLNHGFGGSMIWQVLLYMGKLVYPFTPKRVVMYCGENDIAAGISPKQVRDTYLMFVKLLRKKYSGIPIYYCSMKPSPARWDLWDKFKKGNNLIKAFCLKTKGNHYIDVSTPMLNKNGQIRQDIWLADKLHMNRKGYTDIWIPIIRKALK